MDLMDEMMLCVTMMRYSIQVNDELVGPITTGRGLRQDNPLLPYFLLSCALRVYQRNQSSLHAKYVAR